MALKDWKKFPAVRGKKQKGTQVNVAWIRKDKGEIITVTEYLIGGSFPDFRDFTGQTEWVFDSSISPSQIQNFRTREEAIREAKRYMKKR